MILTMSSIIFMKYKKVYLLLEGEAPSPRKTSLEATRTRLGLPTIDLPGHDVLVLTIILKTRLKA